jgi:hypothetical protein
MALYRLTKADVANIKKAMLEQSQQDWMEPVFRSLANPVQEPRLKHQGTIAPSVKSTGETP